MDGQQSSCMLYFIDHCKVLHIPAMSQKVYRPLWPPNQKHSTNNDVESSVVECYVSPNERYANLFTPAGPSLVMIKSKLLSVKDSIGIDMFMNKVSMSTHIFDWEVHM